MVNVRFTIAAFRANFYSLRVLNFIIEQHFIAVAMRTYGKKKRSILSSFSALRDSGDTSKPKSASRKRGSSAAAVSSMPSILDSNSNSKHTAHSSDSIDEMANMLLDDTTTDQVENFNSGQQSYLPTAISAPNVRYNNLSNGKILPQLPTLDFGISPNEALKNYPLDANSPQKPTTPAIPRKSSKRKSARSQNSFSPTRIKESDDPSSRPWSSLNANKQGLKSSISAPILNTYHSTGSVGPSDVNAKIEAMLAASRALKPAEDGAVFHGPMVPAKKRRLIDNKVLAKVKTAINHRLSARSASKRNDPIKDDKLLDPSVSELPEFQDDRSISDRGPTSLEIRMNEGLNFKNPKIFTMTGHGNIRRKPIAEDGKSLRSLGSAEDPFSERPHSNRSQPTTSSDTRFHEILYEEVIPELSELQSLTHTPMKQLRTTTVDINEQASMVFDAMFSSSPLAESTPRVRLEPTIKADLKEIAIDDAVSFHSFHPDDSEMESDMDINDEAGDLAVSAMLEDAKHRKFQANESTIHSLHSKNIKKHSSLSKLELEKLEKAMRNFPLDNDLNFESLPNASALAPRNTNTKILSSTRQRFQAPQSKLSGSMPDLNRRNPPRISSLPKSSTRINLEDNSMMDIDELQWDETSYNIGTRKT